MIQIVPPRDWSKTIQAEVIFHTSCAFLLTILLVSMVLALRGNQAAKYFLWVWAALMILALPLMNRANMISYIVTGLTFVFFLCMFYITVCYGMEHVDVSREEARRVLAESNRHIGEERRTPARRLCDGVDPQLLLTHNVLKQLELLVVGNGRVAELPGNASGMPNGAYTEMHDIIKDTRIEVIGSAGFTVALESLVARYTNISEEPVITLEHDLPKRPAIPEASVISACKIIREATFNVVKRPEAAQVCISIHHNKALDIYKMETTDGGAGMKVTARNGEHASVGLIDMRERVQVLGGALKIQTADPANQK